MSARVPEVFVDGETSMLLTAGMVRIDLHALETSRRSVRDNQVQTVLVRLELSPVGFMQTVESIGRFLAEHKIRPPAQPMDGRDGPVSPNFAIR